MGQAESKVLESNEYIFNLLCHDIKSAERKPSIWKENVGCASPRFGLFKGVKNEEKTCWPYQKIGTKLSLREQRSGNNWAFHPRGRTFFLMRNSEIKWYTITLKADLTCLDEEALEGGPARASAMHILITEKAYPTGWGQRSGSPCPLGSDSPLATLKMESQAGAQRVSGTGPS